MTPQVKSKWASVSHNACNWKMCKLAVKINRWLILDLRGPNDNIFNFR